MPQHIEAVVPWQIQVKNNDVGTPCILVRVYPRQVCNCLLTVQHGMDIYREIFQPDGFADKQCVGEIILGQQQIPGLRFRPLFPVEGR